MAVGEGTGNKSEELVGSGYESPDPAVEGISPGPFKFIFIRGKWQPDEAYLPTVNALQEMGHQAIIATTYGHEVDATIMDDVDSIVDAAEDDDNLVLVFHSRGIESAEYVVEKLGPQRIEAMVASNTAGQHNLELPARFSGHGIEVRYYDGFRDPKGIVDQGDGTDIITPGHAIKYLYHDMPSGTSRNTILSKLFPNRIDINSPNYNPGLPYGDIAIYSVRGLLDRVHGRKWAARVDDEYFKTVVETIETGHSPFSSRPDSASMLLENLATRGRLFRTYRSQF
jgi:hypothetical protein